MIFLNPSLVNKTVRTLGDGKMFSVVFQKKDGSIRTMNARLGVKKHLAGGKSTLSHLDHLKVVFDLRKREYRCFDKTKVISIRSHGQLRKAA